MTEIQISALKNAEKHFQAARESLEIIPEEHRNPFVSGVLGITKMLIDGCGNVLDREKKD